MTVGHIQSVLDGYPFGGTKKLLLLGIANHDGDGGAWPLVATLARYAGVTERQAKRALSELVADGWLTVHLNQGGTRNTRADRRSNLYEPNYDRMNGVAPMTPRAADGVSASAPRGGAHAMASAPPEPPTDVTTQEPPNPPTPRRSYASHDLAFQAFWSVYPRKQAKDDARKAWRQALGKGADPAHIVAGAERYRDDPNREPEYTKLPAGWLRDGRWDDDPLPARNGRGTNVALRRLASRPAAGPGVGGLFALPSA